ncbi:RES family NAD+ phosphorylase [Stakelama sp. CBK3Z-3]|uniref:RES family NAD+ phosphorylase n=1 Tax=Stakelama flava TaxID=2860338 RepID=A0ABS6XJ90_9SPHN|nr:RES family NAD+ phosphorylase [Stakelama flava]MBW4330284.1 RES family NAD+ phosphorylase [Stakelama flava]
MNHALAPLSDRYWRMLGVRWQHRPFESGSHLTGGRWNPVGTPALYLSQSHHTAIVEMHQNLVRPGTLVAFDVEADAIADLRGEDASLTHGLWRDQAMLRGEVPESWRLAERLIAEGAQGALIPSVLDPAGTNLVLWCWYREGEAGEGASLTLIDPEAVLSDDKR